MSLAKVNVALRTAYREALPEIPTEWPNRKFTVPAGGVWARFAIMPARNTVHTLGERGTNLQSGVLQIDIHVPTLSGITELDEYADLLVNSFWAGRRLVHDGQVVRIRIAEPSANWEATGSQHTVRSVTVYWETESQRAGA